MTPKFLIPLLALALWIAASPTSLAAQDPDSTKEGRSIAVPRRLGPFRLVRQQPYDDPRLGTMFRYVALDSQLVDVFVYPGPDFGKNCAMECAQEAIQNEVDEFKNSFTMMRERGYVDSIEVAAEDTLSPDSSDVWKIGRAMRLNIVRRGTPLVSDWVVWYVPIFRIKVRATYPDREPERAYVRMFADSIVAAIEAESRAEERTRGITMTASYAGSIDSHVPRVAAAMRALGYIISDSIGNENGVFLRSTPRSDWTGSSLLERFGTASDSIRLLVIIEPRNDSTVIQIATQFAASATTYGDSVSMMRTAAVIEFAASLTKDPEKEAPPPNQNPPAEFATLRRTHGPAHRMATW